MTIDDTYYCTLRRRMMATTAAADAANLARNTHGLQSRQRAATTPLSVHRYRYNEPKRSRIATRSLY